jgi:hypothetical protein
MKSPLAATTFSSLGRKRLQPILVASLGMLLKELLDGGDQGLCGGIRWHVGYTVKILS